jgi:hypothetical protein
LPTDYVDVFSAIVPENEHLTPDNILVAIWTDFPQWVRVLFKLRDWLVKLFGLKTGENEKDFEQKFEAAIRNSGQYNLMTVPAKSADETVMRLTDKYLTTELSVCNEKQNDNQLKISIITLVHFHNALGKIYFLLFVHFIKL